MGEKRVGGRPATVAAGTVVRRTRWGPAQVVRTCKQWCDQDEAVFLDALADTCNVRMACAIAGVATTTVYRQRHLRADFAHRWQAAIEQGYAELEVSLIRAAQEAVDTNRAPSPTRRVRAMSAETALKVLQSHRASATGKGKVGGWSRPPRRLEEVQDEILRKVDAIRRARSETGEDGAPR